MRTMFATQNALVIKAMIANNNVHRMLWELCRHIVFPSVRKDGLKVNDLKPSPNPVYDFMRDSIISLGVISNDLGRVTETILCNGGLFGNRPAFSFQRRFRETLLEGVEGHD